MTFFHILKVMKFKEYLFTSLVFVNLAIGTTNLRVEDYTSTNKKNKEILKVSINQNEPYVVKSTGSVASFSERIAALETLLILGMALGAILSTWVYKNTTKIEKYIKNVIKFVSRETFLALRIISRIKKFYYLGVPSNKLQFYHS